MSTNTDALVRELREKQLRGIYPDFDKRARQAADTIERLTRALHEIAEEWAGAECGEPVHAQEAYAIGLAKRMYLLAAAAIRTTKE